MSKARASSSSSFLATLAAVTSALGAGLPVPATAADASAPPATAPVPIARSAIAAPPPFITGAGLPPGTFVLTYDDGPDAHTLELARYLRSQAIEATFFINGARTCRRRGSVCVPAPRSACAPDPADEPHYDEAILGELVRLGHHLANHSQSHCDLSRETRLAVDELRTTEAIVRRHDPRGPFVFRAPYGAWTAASDAATKDFLAAARLKGPVSQDPTQLTCRSRRDLRGYGEDRTRTASRPDGSRSGDVDG